jgi:lipopolysaccharide export system protein LptA
LAAAALAGGSTAVAQIADSNAPVQVTSTKDAVYSRAEGVFTYTENVKVVQGGSQLTSDKLTVYCNRTAGQAAKPEDTCDPISRIVAEGDVIYTTPRESIRGDRGEYDYTNDTITITGKVILSRGREGLVSGTKVVYQVGTGLVTITSDQSKPVFSIFTPQKKADQPAAPGTPAPAPSRPN